VNAGLVTGTGWPNALTAQTVPPWGTVPADAAAGPTAAASANTTATAASGYRPVNVPERRDADIAPPQSELPEHLHAMRRYLYPHLNQLTHVSKTSSWVATTEQREAR
jgi:hypothetical protein